MSNIEIGQIFVDFSLNHLFFRLSNLKITNFVRFFQLFLRHFCPFFQFISHGGAILEPRQPRYFQPIDFREAAFVLEQFESSMFRFPSFFVK